MTGTVAETASRRLDVDATALPSCASDESSPVTLPRPETRRAASRRSVGRSVAVPIALAPNPVSIAPQWRVMAAVKLAVVLLVVAIGGALPSWWVATMLVIAIAIDAAAPLLARYEAESIEARGKVAALCTGIVLPMALFGAAMAEWVLSGPASVTSAAIGGVAIVVLIASIIEAARPPGLLAAHCSLWTGVACAVSGLSGVIAVAFGLPLAITVFVRQLRIDRAGAERAAAAERIHSRAREILADYEETGQGWFWETDRRAMLTYLSDPVAAIVGASVEELTGRPFAGLFDLAALSEDSERSLAFALTARSSFSDLGVKAATADGDERWWSINGRPIYDEFKNFQGFRGSGTDLTEKRRSAEHASRLAHYDSLTGLSNRFLQSQSLEKILTAPQIHQRSCSVLLLDLDRFKQVNDTLGHPAGDALLKQVAQRLERTTGKAGRVGRLGGDEFQVLLPGRIERAQLSLLAGQIIDALSQPYTIDGLRVVIGASIGIALAPDDGVTSEALIRNADLALYAAKDGGRGRFHFYAADLHSDAEERRQMEADLRDAIASGGLELYYQPVVQTATEKITGFEALLRWTHPVRGPISPAKFIPVAEDAGLIAPIGEWALRTACRDMALWPEEVRCAVNVSPLQFANPALPAIVTSALAQAQIAPDRLELEITESVFLNDSEGTDAMFKALKGIGVRLALDDFGTGYSSLGYLKKAPFDKIKIDQSFVRGATIEGSRNGAIIAAIVSLAEALGMETTAEGVETFDELDLVRMLGCSHVQGYIYERPLSSANALSRLASGLMAIAEGPRAARATRQSMLRKIVIEHDGHVYNASVRNISATGALIEGLWNVPRDTVFSIQLAQDRACTATVRWAREDRMGVEFSEPLKFTVDGQIAPMAARANPAVPRAEQLRLAG